MKMVYVDADACPVKAEIIRVAIRRGWRVVMVSNSGMRPDPSGIVQNIMVGNRFDEADDAIAERAEAGDVVVTSDILLAARCIEKHAQVLAPNGKAFTEHGIGSAVAMRNLNAHLRETGESKGHNAGFTTKDRSQFLQALDAAMQKVTT